MSVADGPSVLVVEPRLEATSSGRSVGWWGTVGLVATEGMLFALLLFGNFYLRARSPDWPQGGIEKPELAMSAVRTVILLSSTVPAVLAERAIRRGRRRRGAVCLAITILLGTLFLLGSADEYRVLRDRFQPSTNAYGSVFYTITGLHALHVAIGVMVLSFLLWRLLAGHYRGTRTQPVENGILYWHFVDVVWVAVYTSLYLSVSL